MDIMNIYNFSTDIDLQSSNEYSEFTILYGYPWFNYGYPELYAGKNHWYPLNWIMDVNI